MTEFKRGDRVRLIFTDDEWTNLKPGATGTVQGISKGPGGEDIISMLWDDGSRLAIIPESGDQIEKLS